MRRVSRDPAELRKALKKGKGKLDADAIEKSVDIT
jgi:hypothetical protein